METAFHSEIHDYAPLIRGASLRRNLHTGAIVAGSFSGGILGVQWLALTSSVTFLVLICIRLRQRRARD